MRQIVLFNEYFPLSDSEETEINLIYINHIILALTKISVFIWNIRLTWNIRFFAHLSSV